MAQRFITRSQLIGRCHAVNIMRNKRSAAERIACRQRVRGRGEREKEREREKHIIARVGMQSTDTLRTRAKHGATPTTSASTTSTHAHASALTFILSLAKAYRGWVCVCLWHESSTTTRYDVLRSALSFFPPRLPVSFSTPAVRPRGKGEFHKSRNSLTRHLDQRATYAGADMRYINFLKDVPLYRPSV